MPAIELENLTARQKAAIVVMTLGADAQELMQKLGQAEIERLAVEFVQLGTVPEAVRDQVLAEFHNRLAASRIGEGGLQRAAKVLEASLGKEQASVAVKRMEWRANQRLRAYARLDPARFAQMIGREHPQTAAFLLTQLEKNVSARVIEALPEVLQHEMVWRVATMRAIEPEIAAAVHAALETCYRAAAGSQPPEPFGGEDRAAGVLTLVGLEAQKALLESLASKDGDMARRVRKMMFTFQDVLLVDDRGIQRFLKEVDTKVLATALKPASPAIQEKIFKNISERAGKNLREEMEYMQRLRPAEIEEAQEQIIDRMRELEESGEIVIDRTGGTGDAR
jgi:flagellar motor switch protein FliG